MHYIFRQLIKCLIAPAVMFALVDVSAQVSDCPFNVRSGSGNSIGAQTTLDGLLITRYGQGLRGAPLVNGTGANADAVETFIQNHRDRLDINGNGAVDEIDGLVITRVLSQYSASNASTVTNRTLGARKTVAAMAQYLSAGCRALNLRVEGLALGSSLTITQGVNTITATLNDRYSMPLSGAVGSMLNVSLGAQPPGQSCAVSEDSDQTVNASNRTVYVRCVHTAAAQLTRPATEPNEPINVLFGLRERAYPGITYDSRLGVSGGTFPYEFRITGYTVNGAVESTTGLSLDFRRGRLRFKPQAAGAHAVTIEIRDSGETQRTLTRTFTIDVAANSTLFVAANGVDAVGRGTLASPFKTAGYAKSQSQPNQILMVRGGQYLPAEPIKFDDTRAKQIIAYPDEEVMFDFQRADRYFGSFEANIRQAPAARIEGIDNINTTQWGIASGFSNAGLIVRNVRFTYGKSVNNSENPGFLFTWDNARAAEGGTPLPHHRLLLQDNDFGTYIGPAGASMVAYDVGDSVIENNQSRLGEEVIGGWIDKDNALNTTYRQNYIEFSGAGDANGILLWHQWGGVNVHVHHNLLVKAGIVIGSMCTQDGCFIRDNNVHYNTLVGGSIRLSWGVYNATSSGTRISRNVIASRTDAPYGTYCYAIPSGGASKVMVATNLIESSNSLAQDDTGCGGDLNWTEWQALGRDTAASGSVRVTVPAIVGSGATLGLATSDTRRASFGHLR
jgi:hypothetical protein